MGEKHCRNINDMSEKRCSNRNIMNGKSSRNRNIAEEKSCSRIRKSCGKLWSLARKLETNCHKVSHKLEKVRRQAGKSLCKCAKKFIQAMALRKRNFRAMCRKSLYKCTENEEAGKVQSCADVRRNTRNACTNVQKIVGNWWKTHESVLKTHESAL